MTHGQQGVVFTDPGCDQEGAKKAGVEFTRWRAARGEVGLVPACCDRSQLLTLFTLFTGRAYRPLPRFGYGEFKANSFDAADMTAGAEMKPPPPLQGEGSITKERIRIVDAKCYQV